MYMKQERYDEGLVCKFAVCAYSEIGGSAYPDANNINIVPSSMSMLVERRWSLLSTENLFARYFLAYNHVNKFRNILSILWTGTHFR